MKNQYNSSGFGVVEIVLVVVVIGIIAVIGFRAYSATSTPAATQQNSQVTPKDSAPEINSSSDLQKAEQALDQTDIEGSDEAALDAQLSF